MIPVGIYVRHSDDDFNDEGQLTREAVARQETDCRQLAGDLGVTVVRVYDDNNITAANDRIRRPNFEQLLEDLEAGVIQGCLFYHADRIARLELDAARVSRVFRMNPRLIGRSVQGGTDLSTDEGRAMFMMQAVMAGMEVAAVRRRATRWHRDAAVKGNNQGGKRPFGWESDRKALRDWEAKLVAKAIRDIPEGKTIGMIRKEWIEAGVSPTAEGKGPLRDHAVLVCLLNPRVCGYRVYIPSAERREAKSLWLPDHILYVDGRPVKGNWQPIVTPEEWRASVAVLEGRREIRQNHEFSRNHAKYLLSGIARCGKCGAKLYGHVNTGDSVHRYICLGREGGCNGIKRIGPALDKHVEALFLEEARHSLETAQNDDADGSVYDCRITKLREEIREAMDRRKPEHPRRISTAAAMNLVSELEGEIADLTYESRVLAAAKVKRQQDIPSLLRDWDSYTIDMKRDRLRRNISAVVVNKTRRGARFDPSCIEIVWSD